jgi:hypothetical protein
MYTDLDRLHKVSMAEDNKARSGKTFELCHIVAGVMEVTEQNGVHCKVLDYNRVPYIMDALVLFVLPDHDINFECTVNRNTFSFILPNGDRKRINFILSDDEEALKGSLWPVVEFSENSNKEDNEKFVLVPQSDIDRLEEARVFLCDNPNSCLSEILTHVTPAMWHITHRRYPEGIKK